jgi:hypothetical protein
MSAAILVVEGTVPELPGGGTLVHVRVDCSDDPLGELARLLDAADAFAGFHRAVAQLTSGDAAALATVEGALEHLPGEGNLRFVRAGALVASGAPDAAAAELRALVADRPSWAVVIRSFATQGLLALPEGVTIDDVLSGT